MLRTATTVYAVPQQLAPLPARVYSGAESRRLDRVAIDDHGIPGIVLMKRAGASAFAALCDTWPAARSMCVVCGKGNNAGDGYIMAGLGRARGLAVNLVQLGPAGRLDGDAGLARDWALEQGVVPLEVDADDPEFDLDADVIVDALLGTGLNGEVRPGYARAIRRINSHRDSQRNSAGKGTGAGVLAVDLPSGVCADSGRVLGEAIRADLTVTFICTKRGLCTGPGVEQVGRIVFADLDVPDSVFAGEVGVPVLKWPALREALGARPRNAYKNRFGHILVLGGDLGMGGAVALAAEAALRVGAGLVSVVSRREHIAAILARRPELMALAADSDGVAERVAMADVIAVGPGLGRGDWGRKQLETAIGSGKPCVVDADGLNLLVDSAAALPPDCVITPHPGEAARLLSCTSAEVQADRFGAVRELAGRYRATAVLKGAGSLVCAPDGVPELCLLGNPGMATAGMGDVLSGVIAGLMGQLPANTAAGLGVCLHSAAGDRVAARQGERGLVALDVVEALLAELNG